MPGYFKELFYDYFLVFIMIFAMIVASIGGLILSYTSKHNPNNIMFYICNNMGIMDCSGIIFRIYRIHVVFHVFYDNFSYCYSNSANFNEHICESDIQNNHVSNNVDNGIGSCIYNSPI